MINCSQIFSDEALLQRVQEVGQSMSQLRNLRRQVWEAEARALAKRRQRIIQSSIKETSFDRVAAGGRS
jgi:hypothetical protein